MVKRSLLLSYRGLPKSWEESAKDQLNSASAIKVEKACKAILGSKKGGIGIYSFRTLY